MRTSHEHVRDQEKPGRCSEEVQPMHGVGPHEPVVGCYTIKLMQQRVRLVYSVRNDQLLVASIAVDKCEDGAADQAQSPGPPLQPLQRFQRNR